MFGSARAGGFGGLRLLARAEWRTRWRSHVVLALVASGTVAVVLAALTGASRSERAFHRLRAATHAADVVVYAPDGSDPAGFVKAFRNISGVEDATLESQVWVRPKGSSHFPDYDLYAIAPLASSGAARVNLPLIVSGRAVDSGQADEVALNESLAAELGVRVGQTITLESMTAHWVDVADKGDAGPPDGPVVRVKVVGLARTPAEFGTWKAIIHLSSAFVARYGKRVEVRTAVQARLSPQALRAATSGTLAGVDPAAQMAPSPFADDAGTDDGLGTVATALRLIGTAAALAGVAATTMVAARLAGLAMLDRATLVSLGCTRRHLSATVVVTLAPWVLAGAGVGLVAGLAASPFTMVSLARSIDPASRSIVLDRGVLLGTVLATLAVATGMLGVIAQRASAHRHPRARPPRRGVPLQRPLPCALGVRAALFGDSAGGGRTSRGTTLALGVAVAAMVAALGVSASISRLERDPSLTGQATSRVIDSGEATATYDRALPRLERDPRVAMLAGLHVAPGITADGEDVTALAYDLRRGDIGASVLHGRIARQPDEVALGPVTLEHLNKHVGQSIELRAESKRAVFRIVGSMLFPQGDFTYDDGVALTSAGADRLLGNTHDNAAIHQVAFAWNDTVDETAADKALAAVGLPVLTNDSALQPTPSRTSRELKHCPATSRSSSVFSPSSCSPTRCW